MESENATDAVFLDGFLQRDLQCHLARLDGIPGDDDLAMTQEMVVHHAGGNHRDDHLVVADDVAPCRFGKAQCMDDRAVDFGPVHRIDQGAVAFLVLLAHVVVPGRGGKEQPLANRQVGVFEGEAETGALAAGGLVGLVEYSQVERPDSALTVDRHACGNHLGRLVG